MLCLRICWTFGRLRCNVGLSDLCRRWSSFQFVPSRSALCEREGWSFALAYTPLCHICNIHTPLWRSFNIVSTRNFCIRVTVHRTIPSPAVGTLKLRMICTNAWHLLYRLDSWFWWRILKYTNSISNQICTFYASISMPYQSFLCSFRLVQVLGCGARPFWPLQSTLLRPLWRF